MQKNIVSYTALGLMSGTSLDGVDLALCRFYKNRNKWQFEIIDATTLSYPGKIKKQLQEAHQMPAFDFLIFHKKYGHFLGNLIQSFLSEKDMQPDIIASHGHTIFHQPNKGITFQIGDGASIAAQTGINTVCDFRTLDVIMGGEGAPLVPIGDQFLFDDYDYCLNLGGFANISFQDTNKKRIAFDVCPVNTVANYFSRIIGREYDDSGKLGAKGKPIPELLKQLNQLEYYKQKYPKSLGVEWLNDCFYPLLEKYKHIPADILRTHYEHVALQIAKATKHNQQKKLLITGGGAYNDFLIERIKYHCSHQIIIPEKKIIDYKEALIFAFLGVLHLRDEINCLQTVTGAKMDNCGGKMWKINPRD